MWRRARPDPAVEAAWAGFLGFAKALDEGSRALLATVPSARRPGAPLEASVAGFLAGLEAARAELPSWDHPALAGAQAATAAALDAAEAAPASSPRPAPAWSSSTATSAWPRSWTNCCRCRRPSRSCGRCAAAAIRPGPAAGRPGRAGSRRRPPRPPR
jgi:hypothetical protein